MPIAPHSGHASQWALCGLLVAVVGATLVGVSCNSDAPASTQDQVAYPWTLGTVFPPPVVPADNPMSVPKALLGRYLFYDVRLSGNQTYACGTCHQQARAFTDGRARAIGSTGTEIRHNAMSLTNVAYNSAFTWASNVIRTLESQATIPMFSSEPVELGLSDMEATVTARLQADPRYPAMFSAAFPGDPAPVSIGNVVRAIASFERTLISNHSPWDLYQQTGDASMVSASAIRGNALFHGETCECYHCHADPFNQSEDVTYVGLAFPNVNFRNNGLYNVDGMGAYPLGDQGLIELSHQAPDMGRFRPPTLRNVALTAPYMHDGSIATLEEVVAQYAAGGRTITSGPYAGVGYANPHKDSFVRGFNLTPDQTEDLLNFLRSLTDMTFVTDPRFSNPFTSGPSAPDAQVPNDAGEDVFEWAPADGGVVTTDAGVGAGMDAGVTADGS